MRKVQTYAVVIEVAVDSPATVGDIYDALCNYLHEGDDTLMRAYTIDIVDVDLSSIRKYRTIETEDE